MEIVDILQETLDYIDRHITDNITADMLSARAGYSIWHFSRVFRWGVGYTVMEYVRNRRLLYAAHELGSGRRIIDIAMDYGFETHSGFSRAFRRYFGYTPEICRMHVKYDKPKPPSLPRMQHYLNGGIIMEPKLVTLPVVKIAGYGIKTANTGGENNKAIPAFWGQYLTDGRVQRLHSESFVKRHAEYGACFPENHETGEFEYVIGVEVKEGADVTDEYCVRELPAATYAVFSTPPCDDASFSPTIQGVWQYIMAEWFPSSGYEYAPNCVDFELYDERCMSKTGKICDIYIPVVKK